MLACPIVVCSSISRVRAAPRLIDEDQAPKNTADRPEGLEPIMSTTATAKTKFLYLFRFPAGETPKTASPEEMQAQYAAWSAWKAKFEKEVVPGEGLKSAGAVVKGGNVTDGPFIEAKEVMGSYAF